VIGWQRRFMSKSTKPFSLGRTIVVGLAVATAFSLLSLFFLFMQARGADHRLTGEVVAVESDTLTIQNGRGEVTLLVVLPDIELRGVDSVEELVPGQHIMTRGNFTEDGTFEAEGLRVLKGFD
jgi:hypothetical protein